jgi:hypothetical protein
MIALMMILQTSFLNDHVVEAFTPFNKLDRYGPSSATSLSAFGGRIMQDLKSKFKRKIDPETSADIYMNPGEERVDSITTTFAMPFVKNSRTSP